ncbi:hypothetical protein [Siphonobacter aquaeclarae]|uniref:4-amino-4-deoxy-L-arabinose transferase n=1 Tax=Siphonobacter aquaeclarae TaxID=563176 RepID=A0A1G9LGW9_9BACT|nr:hypothetical protein [Siphonobacter aquaeclarae]SDL61077.1 hypothetical protein SAMN04488090_1411 [Siphonobacter aquaeclarae]
MNLSKVLASAIGEQRAAWFVSLGITAIFLFFVYFFSSPVPFGDDLPAIYEYWRRLSEEITPGEKALVLFSNNYVEHRLLALSLIVFIGQLFSETVPLPFFCLSAALLWTGVLLIYWKWLNRTGLSPWWGVVITGVLLSGASYQTAYWTMAALQHFSVVFLCFLTVFLLSRKLSGGYVAAALVTAFICTFSSGNGMAVWPTGVLILLINQERRFLPVWLAGLLFSISLYLAGVRLGETHSGRSLSTVFDSFWAKSVNLVAGPGGAVLIERSLLDFSDGGVAFSARNPAIYVGIMLLILYLLVFRMALRRSAAGEPDRIAAAIAGTSLFLLMTYAFITFGRSAGEASFVVFKSRYYTYSVAAIANGFFALACLTRNSSWRAWLLGGSLAFTAAFWLVWQCSIYPILLNQRAILDIGYTNYLNRGKWVIYQATSFYENYYHSFFGKEQNKALLPAPPLLVKAYRNRLESAAGFTPCQDLRVDLLDNGVVYAVSLRNEEAPAIQEKGEGYAIAMTSERDTFLLPALHMRNGVLRFLDSGRATRPGYTLNVLLRKNDFPPATYRLHQFYFKDDRGVINPDTVGELLWAQPPSSADR